MGELKIQQLDDSIQQAVDEFFAVSPHLIPHHNGRLSLEAEGKGCYLFALLENNVVGFLFIQWQGFPCKEAAAKYPKIPYIGNGHVDPAFQSQGIGTKLFREAEELAKQRGHKSVCLGVGVENPRAMSLYERLGYIAYREDMYSDVWVKRNPDGTETPMVDTCIPMTKKLSE